MWVCSTVLPCSVCFSLCVYCRGAFDPVNIACTQNTVAAISQAVKWWPIFFSRIWLPGFIKIGSKEASFPFDFNEGSVVDRRLLIYTLLLKALRHTVQDPAVASHSSTHALSYTHLHLYAPQAPPLFIVKYGGPEIYTDARMNNKYIHIENDEWEPSCHLRLSQQAL